MEFRELELTYAPIINLPSLFILLLHPVTVLVPLSLSLCLSVCTSPLFASFHTVTLIVVSMNRPLKTSGLPLPSNTAIKMHGNICSRHRQHMGKSKCSNEGVCQPLESIYCRLEKKGDLERAVKCYRSIVLDDPTSEAATKRLEVILALQESQVCVHHTSQGVVSVSVGVREDCVDTLVPC